MITKYNESPFQYKRRPTREVSVGGVGIGGNNPIRVQSMTNTDTKNVEATLVQIRELEEAGSELVRLTVPTTQDAESLPLIRKRMKEEGINVPLVADIHFTPSIAMKAVEYVEKVRINPGNFADRKKFTILEYSDSEYNQELDRIYTSFSPLVKRAKELGVAMRIGTNHGSLSDRIMNRYGDTPEGMVESALEFIRIAESLSYKDIIVSMKASNTQVMIHAYRLLVSRFYEYGMDYPLHLGVTEAGDGTDGRIKSCIGIGSLLDDGLGDTIRVSLTEDPVLEIPVAKKIVEKYNKLMKMDQPEKSMNRMGGLDQDSSERFDSEKYLEFRNPFRYSRFYSNELRLGGETCKARSWIGGENTIRVEACFTQFPTQVFNTIQDTILTGVKKSISPESLHFHVQSSYELQELASLKLNKELTLPISFILQNTMLVDYKYNIDSIKTLDKWVTYYPQFSTNLEEEEFFEAMSIFQKAGGCTEWMIRSNDIPQIPNLLHVLDYWNLENSIFSMESDDLIRDYRMLASELSSKFYPILLSSYNNDYDSALYSTSINFGGLLIDGIGDLVRIEIKDRIFDSISLSYDILQGSRLRLSKTEYISCPSCGRTQFDLQETTQRIKLNTNHLKGLKIAVMGCIVNGPGEMADADFGYVGAAPGKVHLYKGKEIILKNVPESEAPDKLIQLIKDNDKWVDPTTID